MKLSGFTFIRNAVSFDYPVIESISSILPIVDEFIVNVGPDEDGTLELIKSIDNPKIKIIQSAWNPNIKKGGHVYAQQTNIALFNCSGKWAFYLQADEVVHEEDLPVIMDHVDRYIDDDRVEGLALEELTFWGDYKTMVKVYPWKYSRRCWIIKPHRFVLSRGDASSFTVHPKYKEKGRKIRVIDTRAKVFHYSLVKSEKEINEKYRTVFNYWSDAFSNELTTNYKHDFYNSYPREFVEFYHGKHPSVMNERILKHGTSIDMSSNLWRHRLSFKDRQKILKTKLIKMFGDRWIGRRDYVLLKEK